MSNTSTTIGSLDKIALYSYKALSYRDGRGAFGECE